MARVNFVDICYKLEGYDRNSSEESRAEALFRRLATARKDLIACTEEDAFGKGDPENLVQCKARYAGAWSDVLKLIDAYIKASERSERFWDIWDIILDIQEEGWMATDYQECADFLEDLTKTVDLNALIISRLELF